VDQIREKRSGLWSWRKDASILVLKVRNADLAAKEKMKPVKSGCQAGGKKEKIASCPDFGKKTICIRIGNSKKKKKKKLEKTRARTEKEMSIHLKRRMATRHLGESKSLAERGSLLGGGT